MLQTIREHTQGWIAGTIVVLIILSFALWGIHSYFVGGGNQDTVAKVNGVDITREQLSMAYERMRRQAQNQYGSNGLSGMNNESALKDRALQTLIDVEVLKQASFNQGFRISDHQIDSYLQSMPEFQIDGRFSVERFQEILSSTLLPVSEFLDLIRTSLLIDQPKLGTIFTSFALPDETAYTIALVNQERDIEYMTIPLSFFLAEPINISESNIKTYYDQHQSDFMTPGQVNLEYIQLSLKDLSDKLNPTDAMLKNFYNENINSYTQPTTWKLAAITLPVPINASSEAIARAEHSLSALMDAIKSGKDFSKIAREHGDTLMAHGWTTLTEVPPELQKAVALLNQRGQMSDLIKTNQGWVVVKAIDIQEPKIQTFEVVKNKVRETYIHQRAEEKFAELRDQLADLTYEHPDSLQLAAKTLNLPIQVSELFTKDKAGKDISQYKKVRDTAFSNDVLNLQNNSDVIQLNPETVIVLRVKSHIASTLLPLHDIAQQIEGKLKTAEAERRAVQFVNEMTLKLDSGTDLHTLASEHQLTWNKTGDIGRYSTKVDSAILDAAFRLPHPSYANKAVYGVAKLPNGYAMVGLLSIKEGTVADAKQYAVFAEQVQNSEGLLEYELYRQSQTKAARIKAG